MIRFILLHKNNHLLVYQAKVTPPHRIFFKILYFLKSYLLKKLKKEIIATFVLSRLLIY